MLSERRRVAAAAEAILHEAALGLLSREGRSTAARAYAVRAAAMSPLDENHQALLIRLYRLAGDDDAAQQQYAACAELFDRELGVAPGVAVEAAMRETAGSAPPSPTTPRSRPSSRPARRRSPPAPPTPGSRRCAPRSRLADGAGAGRLRVGARLCSPRR